CGDRASGVCIAVIGEKDQSSVVPLRIFVSLPALMSAVPPPATLPDLHGHFGPYGGMFVPETLMAALTVLTGEYEQARKDPAFQKELDHLLADYVGRPTPLYFAERWSEKLGGAKVYLKREDLLHTGAHKINNALGQALLALR